MRNISDKSCGENQKHKFWINKMFPERREVYDTRWKKYGNDRKATDDNIIRRMRLCRIAKATDTHSEYIMFIAFPL